MLITIPWMRSTTRGSLSFCAWRRTSSSLEMVALFPFANVGRILPIIAHFSEYVELFMHLYSRPFGSYPKGLAVRRRLQASCKPLPAFACGCQLHRTLRLKAESA